MAAVIAAYLLPLISRCWVHSLSNQCCHRRVPIAHGYAAGGALKDCALVSKRPVRTRWKWALAPPDRGAHGLAPLRRGGLDGHRASQDFPDLEGSPPLAIKIFNEIF